MKTRIARVEPDRVIVRGHDLTDELLGSVTFTDMVALILLGRLPTGAETRMLDALLVVLVEHGLVKPVVVARFVYSNAPESLQAAVAASLLGAGSRHLGSSEWAARMLQEGIGPNADEAAIEAAATRIVEDHATRKERVPGIGHRTHEGGDPRAMRLFDLARETDTFGSHCRLLLRVADLAGERAGRPLPINVTGAIAAIASDMGFRWEITRGFALIGRTLGALGHIQEEMDDPISEELIRTIQRSVESET
ncbi:MAG: citryl-CoA lyase [Chloroflexi bacterium]|nr:citryl-CoA lyase [Chloroflexota bacterium]